MSHPPLHLVVHADPTAVLIVRRSLREWLDALVWPEPDSNDVLIAVNEACTNAIEHAYPSENPGYVRIDGRFVPIRNQRQVTLVVEDGGRWRPIPVVQRFRGHGITVMRGCMHTVNIETGIEGTAVTLTSFAVPPRDEKRRQQ
jgi:serine/threonine-protein kinase RsbW